MKKLLSRFTFVLTLLATLVAARAQAQDFTVSGTRILDPNGNEFVPNGANIGLWTDNATATHVNMIKNVWKFNTVRVYLRLAGGDANSTPTDALLDKYVNAYTTNTNGPRTVVMFECHDKSGSYYREGETPSLTDLRNFWKRVALRYKNNPWVWFNIMNEPGYNTNATQEWYDLHNTVIQDIRAQGANNLIVCDGNNFASEEVNTKAGFATDVGSATLTYGQTLLNADPAKKLVYSFHTYTGWNWSREKIFDFVTRVQNKNLAIMVGEYAATTGNSLGDLDVTEAARFVVEVSKAKKIGKLIWHYWNWDGNALATSQWGGADGSAVNRTDGSRPTNLTWFGELVWDDTHNLAPPATGIPLNRFAWSASSSKTSSNPGAAIDADASTAFNITYVNTSDAPPATAPDWFQVDLGSTQSFNQIVLDTRKSSSSFPRDLKVYVSNSTTFGSPIATITNNAMGVVRVSFTTQSARYIRVEASRFGKDWGVNRNISPLPTYVSWNIADFQVYAPGTYVAPTVCGSELSRSGWTASANKRSGWNQEWEDKALDNNPGTRWTSGGGMADGDTFTVDMKASQTISAIELNAGTSANGYARKYQVYLSADGTNWGNAVVSDLGAPVTRIVLPTNQSARYIRVVCRAALSGEWWSIHEFRVWGGGSCGTGANLLSNPSFDAEAFDTQTPSGWSEWSDLGSVWTSYTEAYGGSASGARHLSHYKYDGAYRVYTYQTKTGLANGLYTVRAKARRGGGQTACYLEAKDFGGTARTAAIPVASTYQLVEMKDVNVTNGQCTVGIYSNAATGQWAYIDDVELIKQ